MSRRLAGLTTGSILCSAPGSNAPNYDADQNGGESAEDALYILMVVARLLPY